MAPAVSSPFEQSIISSFISEYLSASAITLLIYDYFLTLRLEIELIWHSKWTYTKVLFLLIRYLPFLDTVVVFFIPYSIKNHLQPIPQPLYNVIIFLPLWIMVVNTTLAETILAIRTWALWHRNWKVGAIIATAVLGTVIMLVYSAATSSGQLYSQGTIYEYSPGAHQESIMNSSGAWVQYVMLVALQLLVLMPIAISAYRAYRSSNNSRLSHVIHRDGILVYIFFFCCTAAYVIAEVFGVVNLSLSLSQYLKVIMYSTLTTKMILNLRESGRRHEILGTELHTIDDEMAHGETLSLRFANGEDDADESSQRD